MRLTSSQSGFTLLEVILALGLLGILMFFCMNTIIRQIDNRDRIATKEQTLQVANTVMKRIFNDLKHAFVLKKDQNMDYFIEGQGQKPFFSYLDSDLAFFTTNFRSVVKNTPESNIANVRYFTEKDSVSGKLKLMRTEDIVLKNSIKDRTTGKTQEMLPDISKFEVSLWDGGQFIKQWDSNEASFDGMMPKMAKIILEFFPDDLRERKDAKEEKKAEPEPFKLSSIVYLMSAAGQKEPRPVVQDGYIWQ